MGVGGPEFVVNLIGFCCTAGLAQTIDRCRSMGFSILALDFLSLSLKIPSQIIQLIRDFVTNYARNTKTSFSVFSQLFCICHDVLPFVAILPHNLDINVRPSQIGSETTYPCLSPTAVRAAPPGGGVPDYSSV